MVETIKKIVKLYEEGYRPRKFNLKDVIDYIIMLESENAQLRQALADTIIKTDKPKYFK